MSELTKSVAVACVGTLAAACIVTFLWWLVGAMIGVAILGAKWVLGL